MGDSNGNTISTVEHILSALFGLDIDNIFIDLDNQEVPVHDGSKKFVEEIEKVELLTNTSKKYVKILKPVEVKESCKVARVLPFKYTMISTEINYTNQMIGKQSISVILNKDIYKTQILANKNFWIVKGR